MKKSLALLLTGILAVGSMVGCSSNNAVSSTSQKTDATPEKTATVEASGGSENGLTTDNIVLEIWHISIDEKRHQSVKNAIARFEEKYPNIKVQDVPLENDPYKTKLATAMAAGEEPDIFISWGGGWLESFINEGKVLDIDEWVDEIADEYYESALSLFQINGKNYSLPYACGPAPVYYNKQIYKELGLEVPNTLKELEHNADVLLENGYLPFALGNASQWPGALTFINLSLRLGGADPFLDAYNRKNGGTFEHESFIKAGEIIQDWVKKGYYPEGANATNYDTGGSRMLFYTGQAAHIVQTNGMLSNCRSEAPDFYENNLGVFNYPTIEGGKGTGKEILGGGNAYSIAASTKYPKEAFELIRTLTNKEFGQDSVDIAGVISGVKGVEIKDPLTQQVQQLVLNATHIQNFYDQFLPPELGALHKQTTYDMFGLTTTPQKAAADMEAKAKELLGPSN